MVASRDGEPLAGVLETTLAPRPLVLGRERADAPEPDDERRPRLPAGRRALHVPPGARARPAPEEPEADRERQVHPPPRGARQVVAVRRQDRSDTRVAVRVP